MWERLWNVLQSESEKADFSQLFLRLSAALALGLACAGLYHITTRTPGKPAHRAFLATLVLLCVLVAMVMSVIGNVEARAFSLVGTLALVRAFRTAVEDTRDSAFVIFAVGIGMGTGYGYIIAPLAALPLVLLVGLLFRAPLEVPARRAAIVLRLASTHPPGPALTEAMEKHAGPVRLVAMETARGGAALDVRYVVDLPPPDTLIAMVGELSKVEGVQGVEVKETG
jgi:hypothetical protein